MQLRHRLKQKSISTKNARICRTIIGKKNLKYRRRGSIVLVLKEEKREPFLLSLSLSLKLK